MKFKKFTMLAFAALSMLSIAGCSSSRDEDKTTTKVVTTSDTSVDQKYEIYLLAQNSGYTGTYEEWLESIRGDSITVSVVDGCLKWKYSLEDESKYKLLFDLTTLKGENGKSPSVSIGDNGNWFIDNVDTEIRARANDGKGIQTVSKTNTEGLVDTYTITFTDGTTAIFNVTNGSNGTNGLNGEKGDTGNGIRSITKGDSVGLIDTYIITFTDGTTSTFIVTNGKDGAAGAAGKGITSIIKGDTVGLVDSYAIVFSDGTTYTYSITNGAQGAAGADGKGIARVEKTGSVGLVDTYTITFTDGTTSTFTITNGENGSTGATGNGIASIAKTGTEGLVDTYTITFTDNTTTTFTITNGSAGTQGATGNGIASVEKTGSEGLVDTYTITFTNGDTTTFTVTNGADAQASEEAVLYSDDGFAKTIYTYDGDTVTGVYYRYIGAAGWIKLSKKVHTMDVDCETIEEFSWNMDDSKWIGSKKTVYFYSGATLVQTKSFTWSNADEDWASNKYHLTNYVNGKIYSECDYKFSSDLNRFDKWGVEYFGREEYEGSTIIDHIWESETSGETSQNMEVFTILRIEGVKKFEVYFKCKKDTLESEFEPYYLYEAVFDGDEFIGFSEKTEDFYYNPGCLYEKNYTPDPSALNDHCSYEFVYSSEYCVIIPRGKHVISYSNKLIMDRQEIIYRKHFYDYDMDKKKWLSFKEESSILGSDGYAIEVDYFESVNLSAPRLVQKTDIIERDEYHQIIVQIDTTYKEDGTESVWRGLTTYHDNGNTASFIFQYKDSEGEWQNYWKYECPKTEWGYDWVEYHWEDGAWVVGAPDWDIEV